MPDVTVAVPVKDRRARMLRCLDALLRQDHPSYEVLVLDNGSTDGTVEACLEVAATAPVPVRVERVGGPVAAVRNAALRHGSGAVLAFTDSDCLPAPGWLTAGCAALAADPGLGCVQGATLPEHPPEQGWPHTIDIRAFSGRYESCNLLFRREAFEAAGGFDEVLGYDWEDTAAGYALKRTGWRAAFAPDALVHHDVTYPGFAFHLKLHRRQMSNAALAVARYPELRREMFFGRVFLRERNARFAAALLAAALLPRRPLPAVLLALPYADLRLRPWPGAKGVAQGVALDAAVLSGLLRGSVKHRRLVL